MIGSKVTLTAATATKIITGGVGSRTALLKTALTDLVIGGPAVTSATGFAFGAALASPGAPIPIGSDDLYAISATGGDIYVCVAENG